MFTTEKKCTYGLIAELKRRNVFRVGIAKPVQAGNGMVSWKWEGIYFTRLSGKLLEAGVDMACCYTLMLTFTVPCADQQ